MSITRKDTDRIADAIRVVADLPGADRATVQAIVQSIRTNMLADFEFALGFGSRATGIIDLSGADKIAALDMLGQARERAATQHFEHAERGRARYGVSSKLAQKFEAKADEIRRGLHDGDSAVITALSELRTQRNEA